MDSTQSYFIAIVFILVVSNAIAAAVQNEYNSSSTSFTLGQNLSASVPASDSNNAYVGIRAVSGIFLWSFGLLPSWLDSFFIVLRFLGYLIVARWIWIGGG